MNWKEVEIKTTNQAFSAISNLLEEAGASGLFTEKIVSGDDDIIIKAYFEADNQLEQELQKIQEQISGLEDYDLAIGSAQLEIADLEEEDWANNWKENFKPFHITDQIVIKPTWEEYKSSEDEIIIEIDPGQAFGTGHHVTTSSCLEAITTNLSTDTSVLDLGTGTGILSIAAAKLGAAEIFALDIDPVATKVATENAKLNNVADQINFVTGNLVEEVNTNYDLVIANILPHIILELIPDLKDVMHNNSRFILSGIVVEKLAEVKAALTEHNFKIEELIEASEESDDWVTIVGTIEN
ncbi:MAG: 50S ribosomal protein L11 methyltransferase [Bacillota bacterium]